MTAQGRRLLDQWATLVPQWPAGGEVVLRRYADAARRYHDVDHLAAVLDAAASLSQEARRPRLVLLAAWFHDAVYDVRRDDNEEQSALLAERLLADVGLARDDVAEVGRLVRLTARHDPTPDDADGAVLCDADLAVLAGDESAYQEYTRAVRAEYSHVSDEDFRRGRREVLERLLALPALYHTEPARSRWEKAARRNVSAEISALEAAIPR